jgi:hypothetical protein
MLNEIKVALRGLTKSPGFTIIAIATLALAIGANSAVFSLINALLVRPLPYQQPAKLALIWEQFASQALDRIPVSPPEYLDLEKDFQSGTGIAAFNYQTFNLGGGDVPERISGAVVSSSLFPLLRVEPIKGRTFARRTLSALLYSVGAFDATTFIFVTITLAAVALLASYIPALRATRADPMLALSHNA